MSTPEQELKAHTTIYLQPWCSKCEASGEDRMWCQDDVWDGQCDICERRPVKYVLATTPVQSQRCEALVTALEGLIDILHGAQSGFIQGSSTDLVWDTTKNDRIEDARAALASFKDKPHAE